MKSKKRRVSIPKELKEERGLPVTLMALREKAGFTRADGAPAEFCEFFAGFKFSGDPDRRTAIAMVALDTILRDPTMLDGTTCFGGGQIDTAVGAATIILGKDKLDKLCSISGEQDLEQLAEMCGRLAKDSEIKDGVMAARHLWGMYNTAVRSFPSDFFRNGAVDDLQTALLGVAARHLAVFNPDGMDAMEELQTMVAQADKIASLGGRGRFYATPKSEEEAAETFMYMARNGKYSELHNSSLIGEIGPVARASAQTLQKAGVKAARKRKKASKEDEEMAGIEGSDDSVLGEREGETNDWRKNTLLTGNGAFFAGRSFDEVKARYPGYPSPPAPSSKLSYWDVCTQHPATHAICCDLFRQIGQLAAAGGADEGLSRAVTNKMAHHNPKFARLNLLVKLTNGKEFYVPRGRPVNWALQGISEEPFGGPDEQMELSFKKTKGRKSNVVEGDAVGISAYELKSVNYSFMPWVKKAISQYLEEAPFVKGPEDEHQAIVSEIAKPLREAGLSFREAMGVGTEIYDKIVGRGAVGIAATEKELSKAVRNSGNFEDLESEITSILRQLAKDGGGEGNWKNVLRTKENQENLRAVAGERTEEIFHYLETKLQEAENLILGYGVDPSVGRKATAVIVSSYPVGKPSGDVAEAVGESLKNSGVEPAITKNDLLRLAAGATGLAGEAASTGMGVSEEERRQLAETLTELIRSGVGVGEDGHLLGKERLAAEAVQKEYQGICEKIASRLGLEQSAGIEAARKGVGGACAIVPTLERALADHGADLSDELTESVSKYAARYALESPLEQSERYHRKIVLGSGRPSSLDQALGEGEGRDRYSVVASDEKTPDELYRDYETEEVARGGGTWLEEYFAENDGPSFKEDGGDDIFSPFGMAQAASSLFRVVSTKGTEEQSDLLKSFATLQFDGAEAKADGKERQRQINAMLDLVEKEDSIEETSRGERRKFLNWVFSSVLNTAGSDRDGFVINGGVNQNEVKQALFEKIKRYGMPGVIVVEEADAANLNNSLLKAKAWGYEKAGVCLPKSVQPEMDSWMARSGGGVELCSVIRGVPGLKDKVIASIEKDKTGGALTKSISIVLEGEKTKGYSEAVKYLAAIDGGEAAVLSFVREAAPIFHDKLSIAQKAKKDGLKLYLAGEEGDHKGVAESARLDSVLFLEGKGAGIARMVSDYGIRVRVVKGEPTRALREHLDYSSVEVGADGKLPRAELLRKSKIPVSKRILLAAEAAQEARERT